MNFVISYLNPHQIASFKTTEGLHPPPPPGYLTALSQEYSVASFATLRVLSLGCSSCNVVRFCCDLEACNLVMATIMLLKQI
jgi:hypothetical protein